MGEGAIAQCLGFMGNRANHFSSKLTLYSCDNVKLFLCILIPYEMVTRYHDVSQLLTLLFSYSRVISADWMYGRGASDGPCLCAYVTIS